METSKDTAYEKLKEYCALRFVFLYLFIGIMLDYGRKMLVGNYIILLHIVIQAFL